MSRAWCALACALALAALHGGAAAAKLDTARAQAAPAATPADTPSPGSEAALRQVIDQLQRGQPDYASMSKYLAEATRQQLPQIQPYLAGFGKLTEVRFEQKGDSGEDVFIARFERGATEWAIALEDGKIVGLLVRPAS